MYIPHTHSVAPGCAWPLRANGGTTANRSTLAQRGHSLGPRGGEPLVAWALEQKTLHEAAPLSQSPHSATGKKTVEIRPAQHHLCASHEQSVQLRESQGSAALAKDEVRHTHVLPICASPVPVPTKPANITGAGADNIVESAFRQALLHQACARRMWASWGTAGAHNKRATDTAAGWRRFVSNACGWEVQRNGGTACSMPGTGLQRRWFFHLGSGMRGPTAGEPRTILNTPGELLRQRRPGRQRRWPPRPTHGAPVQSMSPRV